MPATTPADRPTAKTGRVNHTRVHLRMDGRTKRVLERAAAYEETTVSSFVLSSAIAAAERVIESRERIILPTTDWDTFCDTLLNPPEPNEALRAAAHRHRERVAECAAGGRQPAERLTAARDSR